VPLRVYDETIRVVKAAVQSAKLGREEELGALRRLDEQARRIEHHVSAASFETLIAAERGGSDYYGGRSVFGWAQPRANFSLIDSNAGGGLSRAHASIFSGRIGRSRTRMPVA
jgi:hypothetical protein